jgi:hypothetical protein
VKAARIIPVVCALALGLIISTAWGSGGGADRIAESGGSESAVAYPALGGSYEGVAPTAVGLPQIGISGTVGAGQIVTALGSYVSSGQYEDDLSSVATAATNYLDTRLTEGAESRHRVCRTGYRRVHVRGVKTRTALYERSKSCVREYTAPRLTGKPAIVLDIDETSLSNLQGLQSTGYTEAGLLPAAAGNLPAIAPTLALYENAIAHGVAVFFITGRDPSLRSVTESNLNAAGFNQGDAALDMKPSSDTTEAFKSSTRQAIEASGYDIILNMGDQESDLDGGYADQAFKLPDPFYFISD